MINPTNPTLLIHQALDVVIARLPRVKRFLVAYSGGRDSTVLLHALATHSCSKQYPLVALHVNHGLQIQADEWQSACKGYASTLGVPFQSFKSHEKPRRGDSIESWARQERYKLLHQQMQDDDVLFTAHHQEDVVETFFINLLRGAGIAGLAVMPDCVALHKGWHVRPLHNISRATINEYIKLNSILYQEDPSNTNQRFSRNFLRHHALPILRERWPALDRTISRTIQLLEHAHQSVIDLADIDLQHVQSLADCSINIVSLNLLPGYRKQALIMRWLALAGADTPQHKHIMQLLERVHTGRDSKICWADTTVHIYQGELHLQLITPVPDEELEFVYSGQDQLVLETGKLIFIPQQGHGIALRRVNAKKLRISFRYGGEKLPMPTGCGQKKLKKFLQEQQIKPWLRHTLPLLYEGKNLIAVADLFAVAEYRAAANEIGVQLKWVPN